MSRRRTSIALIFAVSSGAAVNLLILGGIFAVLNHDSHFVVSDNYVAMISGTLGVMIGALAAVLGRDDSCHCECHKGES